MLFSFVCSLLLLFLLLCSIETIASKETDVCLCLFVFLDPLKLQVDLHNNFVLLCWHFQLAIAGTLSNPKTNIYWPSGHLKAKRFFLHL